jgi:hypothetical protein
VHLLSLPVHLYALQLGSAHGKYDPQLVLWLSELDYVDVSTQFELLCTKPLS